MIAQTRVSYFNIRVPYCIDENCESRNIVLERSVYISCYWGKKVDNFYLGYPSASVGLYHNI